jgi:hypothetical protein
MSNTRDDDEDIPEVEPVRRPRNEGRPVRRRREEYEDDYEEDERPRRRRQYDIGEDAGMRMLLPVGRSGWAIASGYLGLISVLLVPAPFALLTGILAIVEMRRNPRVHGMGRAIFGIIMGTLGTAALAIVAVAVLAHGFK